MTDKHVVPSMSFKPWTGEVCKRCDRRNVIGFTVSDDIWGAVSRGRWNILCPACFDEEAQYLGVSYRFVGVYPVSWCDWCDEKKQPGLLDAIEAQLEILEVCLVSRCESLEMRVRELERHQDNPELRHLCDICGSSPYVTVINGHAVCSLECRRVVLDRR